ncbi:MAG: DUF3465 domain-containing protein [Planctomycetes bacterium]|nr:DUF3465 domain-containing protein [Planctomycetota bacterium]MCB9918546.1 DUF3465 domain-containing protein [Planctomycetota bacterium]
MAESQKKLSPLAAILTLIVGGLIYGGNVLLGKTDKKDSGTAVTKQDGDGGAKANESAASQTATTPPTKTLPTNTSTTKDTPTQKSSTTSSTKSTSSNATTTKTPETKSPANTSSSTTERKPSRFDQGRVGTGAPSVRWGSIDDVARAFAAKKSDVFVEVEGVVVHILPVDNEGTRHQNFLFELSNDITLKISHNIDLADPIPNLRKGMRLRIRGEYEYNEKGGVLHWTHHDPARRHPDGWIEVDGKRYG